MGEPSKSQEGGSHPLAGGPFPCVISTYLALTGPAGRESTGKAVRVGIRGMLFSLQKSFHLPIATHCCQTRGKGYYSMCPICRFQSSTSGLVLHLFWHQRPKSTHLSARHRAVQDAEQIHNGSWATLKYNCRLDRGGAGLPVMLSWPNRLTQPWLTISNGRKKHLFFQLGVSNA